MQPFEGFTIYTQNDFSNLERTPNNINLLKLLDKASLTQSPIQDNKTNECLCCRAEINKWDLCYLTQPWEILYVYAVLGSNRLAIKWITCKDCVTEGLTYNFQF